MDELISKKLSEVDNFVLVLKYYKQLQHCKALRGVRMIDTHRSSVSCPLRSVDCEGYFAKPPPRIDLDATESKARLWALLSDKCT